MQLQRPSTTRITGRGFAVAIFLVGIAWPIIGPSAADEGLGGGGLVATGSSRKVPATRSKTILATATMGPFPCKCAGAEVGHGQICRFDRL